MRAGGGSRAVRGVCVARKNEEVMSVNAVILGFGAILLLIGIVGGGFEIKEFKVPKVGPAPRIISAIGGIFFVFLAMGLEASDAATKRSEPEKEILQPATA